MTSRKGKCIRRKVPRPVLDEVSAVWLPILECPSCKEGFLPTEIKGEFLHRVCPHCGEAISPETYAEQALDVYNKVKESSDELKDYRQQLEHLSDTAVSYTKWWQVLKKMKAFIQIKLLKARTASLIPGLIQDLENGKEQLSTLARYRYYSSEWFLNTHIPLVEEGGPLDVHYRLKTGEYKIFPSGSSQKSGLLGEIKAFKYVVSFASNPYSALYQCRPVPNLYIPIPFDEVHDGGSYWSQVDLLVLTRQCAFVVEVKHWKSCVYVDAETGKIYASNQDMDGLGLPFYVQGKTYYETSTTLDQNSNHASYFYDICKRYPFEKIFEVTLFVDPKSFQSNFTGFVDNIYAGCLGSDCLDSISLMAEVCEALPSIMSTEELNALADNLLNRYGDLNQRRSKMHVKALAC